MDSRDSAIAQRPIRWGGLCRRRHRASSAQAALAPAPVALDIQRLWSLVALEQAVREQSLGSFSLEEVVATLLLSKRGFDELFMARPGCRDRSFDEALALTSSRVARAYRRSTKGGYRRQTSKWVELLLGENDEEPRTSRASCSLLPPPGPRVLVGLWRLPRGTANAPYRHPLSAKELLVVISGCPTLQMGEEIRELRKDRAAIVTEARDSRLVNYTREPVHFLALVSAME